MKQSHNHLMRQLIRPRTLRPKLNLSLSSSRAFTMSDSINRNPHPDFKKVEASREAWDSSSTFTYVKTPDPNWKFGQGRNSLPDPGKDKKHVSIDPYEEGRAGGLNYKLLISAITPRPIAMVSTRSSDGKTENLAVFSYFNVINHDPPLFIIGIASAMAEAKDTLRNIMDTKEAVINIISEPILEAANSTSINAPFGAPEWDVSGLTRDYSCETVKCARVKEAVFSVEAKLDMLKEWESRATPGKKTGTLVILEGTRMWAREDAINDDRSLIDPAILRPMSRLGGITYSRTTEGIELPRPKFDEDLGGEEALKKLQAEKK